MKKIIFMMSLSLIASADCQEKRESISIESLAQTTQYAGKSPEEIYQRLFKDTVLKSNARVIVKFFMPKCGECLSVKLPFEKLTDEMKDVAFYNCNCEPAAFDTLCQELDLDKVPAFIVFIDGKEVARLLGAFSYTDLKKEFVKILDTHKPKSFLNRLLGYIM